VYINPPRPSYVALTLPGLGEGVLLEEDRVHRASWVTGNRAVPRPPLRAMNNLQAETVRIFIYLCFFASIH